MMKAAYLWQLPGLAAILIVLTLTLPASCDDIVSETSSGAIHRNFPFRLKTIDNYSLEITCTVLALLILVNIIRGRRKNERLAVSYTAVLLRADGPVHRNFAVANAEIQKAGPDLFHVYASGRRYCQGMFLTFRMARRQDVVALAVSSATRDIVEIEVAMNPSSFPTTSLFVGTHAAARVVVEQNSDLSTLAKRLEPARDRLAVWPSDALSVHAEHAAIFYDVMSSAAMDIMFGPAAFDDAGFYFRYLHATSEYSYGEHKQMVRLSFTLPPKTDDLATLDRFINLAMLVVDSLGSYKLTPEQAKRATEARHKLETQRPCAAEEQAKRMEERRAAKEAEDKARLAKLPPDQREKEMARKERILRERRMRSMVKKM